MEPIEQAILDKYETIKILQIGAYDRIWKARDKRTENLVLIKQIRGAFCDKIRMKNLLKEIIILQQLANHENIIKLVNVHSSTNKEDLYIVMNFMEGNMYHVMRAGILTEIHINYIAYQLLRALKYLHSGQLVHRNISPNDILINSESLIQIANFMSAILGSSQQKVKQYDKIYFSLYMAPETLGTKVNVSSACDIWSVGCIIAQMLNNGKPIFNIRSSQDWARHVLELLDYPSNKDLSWFPYVMAKELMNDLRKKTFKEAMPLASEEAINVVKGLLALDPQERLTAEQALTLPYFSQFHSPEDEPNFNGTINMPIVYDERLSASKNKEILLAYIWNKKKQLKGSKDYYGFF